MFSCRSSIFRYITLRNPLTRLRECWNDNWLLFCGRYKRRLIKSRAELTFQRTSKWVKNLDLVISNPPLSNGYISELLSRLFLIPKPDSDSEKNKIDDYDFNPDSEQNFLFDSDSDSDSVNFFFGLRLRKTPKMFSYDAPSHSAAHIREFVNQNLCDFKLHIDATKYMLLYFCSLLNTWKIELLSNKNKNICVFYWFNWNIDYEKIIFSDSDSDSENFCVTPQFTRVYQIKKVKFYLCLCFFGPYRWLSLKS